MFYFLEKTITIFVSGSFGILIAFKLGLEGYGRYQSYQIACYIISSCVIFSHLNVIQRYCKDGKLLLWDKYFYMSISLIIGSFIATSFFNFADEIQFVLGVFIMLNMVLENLFASLGVLNLISRYRIILVLFFGSIKAYFLTVSVDYDVFIMLFQLEVLSTFLVLLFFFGRQIYTSNLSIQISQFSRIPTTLIIGGIITQLSFRLVSAICLFTLTLEQLGLYAFFNRLFEINVTLMSAVINYKIDRIRNSLFKFLKLYVGPIVVFQISVGVIFQSVIFLNGNGVFVFEPLLDYLVEPYLHWILIIFVASVFISSSVEKYDALSGNGLYILFNKIFYSVIFVAVVLFAKVDNAFDVFLLSFVSFIIAMVPSMIISLKSGTRYV